MDHIGGRVGWNRDVGHPAGYNFNRDSTTATPSAATEPANCRGGHRAVGFVGRRRLRARQGADFLPPRSSLNHKASTSR
jgi:hypothetical protein